jgi:hypothetical protein
VTGASRRFAGTVALAALGLLASASAAAACVCANEPIEQRLDDADVAVVGRVVDERPGSVRGAAQRLLTVEVDQRVKGDVSRTFELRSPSQTDCDLLVPKDKAIGLLLTRAPDGALVGAACSVVDPGTLVVAGGEPRGGPIKVVIGFAILALVLLWSFRRLKMGKRPHLPGAPRP